VRLAALVLSALLLGGCGERHRAGVGANPDSPVVGTPVPAPTGSSGPLRVSPRSGLVDVRPVPWIRADAVGPRTVEVEFYGGVEECEGLDHVEVRERPDTVRITVFVGRVPEAEVCIELAVLKAATARLEEPLGDRRIVDGARGS
jgi:hypothetical protein